MSELVYSGVAISEGTWCRLCLNNCRDYQILYDKNGICNAACYEIAFKYFHPTFLTIAKTNRLTVLCLKCWCSVSEFNTFQMSILVAQDSLLGRDDIQVEKLPADTAVSTPLLETVHPNNGFGLLGNKIEIKDDDIELMDIADVEAPVEETVINVSAIKHEDNSNYEEHVPTYHEEFEEEYDDDPVGIFIGGEFNNTNKTMDLSELDVINLDSDSDEEMSVLETGIKNERELEIVDTNNIPEPASNPNILQESNDQSRMAETAATTTSKVSAEVLRRREEKKELTNLILQWKPTLDCMICNESVPNYLQLRKHFKKQHPLEMCFIECCQRKLYKSYHIREHAQLHMRPPRFTCNVCERSYKTLRILKSHIRQQHDNVEDPKDDNMLKKKQEICKNIKGESKDERARRNFAEKVLRLKEEKKQFDEFIAQWRPILDCSVCNEPLQTLSLLREHYVQHHPSEKCYIECCGRKFFLRCHIRDHVQTHMFPNGFKCDSCDKTFKTGSELKKHNPCPELKSNDNRAPSNESTRKVTSKDKLRPANESEDILAKWQTPLQCTVCSASYPNFVQLRSHFRHDHPDNTFHISCCQRKYSTGRSIEAHALFHMDPNASKSKDILAQWQTPLQCTVCSATYPNFIQLRSHFRQDHSDSKFYIYCCLRKYSTGSSIEEHALFHMDPNAFKCQLCGLCLTSNVHLYSHQYYVHSITKDGKEIERKHKCGICAKAFRCTTSLQEHVATHTGSDLYKCLHCPMTFKVRSLTYSHFKSCHPKEWAEKDTVRNFFKLMEINNQAD